MNNTTNLSFEDMKDLNKYSFFKNMFFIMILCLAVVGAGIAMIVLEKNEDSSQFIVIIISIVVCVLIIPFSYLFAVVGQSRQIKKHKLDEGFVYEYLFNKDRFEVSTISKDINKKDSIAYHSLFRVSKREECVYLFLNKQQAYIVKYNGFETIADKNNFITLLNNISLK